MKPIKLICADPELTSNRVLSVYRMGLHEIMEARIINRPSGTPDYLFMYFYDKVSIKVDKQIREFPANSFMIWEPGQYHYYGNKRSQWNHSWLHCKGTVIGESLNQSKINLNHPIQVQDSYIFDKYLWEVHNEIITYDKPDPIILKNLFCNWVRELDRLVKHQNKKRNIPQNFLEIKRYIEMNLNKPITLGMLAQRICLSLPHFCAVFKKYFGVSAINYLIQFRMQQAAFLLRNIEMNISEIAFEVGYIDIAYFSKLFKRHYGMCPRAYRKSILLENRKK